VARNPPSTKSLPKIDRLANPLVANKPPFPRRKIHRQRRKTASGLQKNFRQIPNKQGGAFNRSAQFAKALKMEV
jgi:hypothetical protein